MDWCIIGRKVKRFNLLEGVTDVSKLSIQEKVHFNGDFTNYYYLRHLFTFLAIPNHARLTEYSEDYRLTPRHVCAADDQCMRVYQIYWWYRIADIFITAQEKTKFPRINDNKVLFVVLAIFGLDIINMAILQSDMNQVWESADSASQSVTQDTDDWTDY